MNIGEAMSQTAKVHKIQVRNRQSGKIQTGATTEVLIDGQPFRGVTFLKFEVKAKGVAKVLIEMYADVEIDTDLPVDVKIAKEQAVEFALGKMNPTKINPK